MPRSHANPLLDPQTLERVRGLALVARRVVEGALHGLHRSPLHGLSIEFAQHREYSPGDELKHLDWRVIARSDRYVIKQYQQETNLRAVLFVDCSKSMAYGAHKLPGTSVTAAPRGGREPPDLAASPDQLAGQSDQLGAGPGDLAIDVSAASDIERDAGSSERVVPADPHEKLHYAKTLAAALTHLLLGQGDSVGLVLTSYKTVAHVPPRATPGHLMTICHTLERARARGFTDLSGVMRQFATRLKRRSLVIVISDLLDDPDQVLSALGQLHHRGHEVIVFQTLDPRELTFDLGLAAVGVTIIRDLETGAEFEAEPQLIHDLVRKEINTFFDHLDNGARRHGVHLIRCQTTDPAERVLTDYLHSRLKRGRL